MKRKLILVFLCTLCFLFTGCFKKDNLEGIEIVTTAYPYEYIANYLYGEHSLVTSIYPDGTDISSYQLNNKIIDDYSKKELFIYNGLGSDTDLALKLLDRNKDMMIIDATSGINPTYGEEELWLNPSNLLMISQNVKNGLDEYITNNYLKKEIDTAYEELKIKLSELDADIRLTAQNATRKTIVVNKDSLKFLERYGFTIISLDEENEPVTDKTISTVKSLIESKQVGHLFILEKSKTNKVTQSIIDETGIATFTFKKIDNMTDEERDSSKDYFSLMQDNIDLLKNELY